MICTGIEGAGQSLARIAMCDDNRPGCAGRETARRLFSDRREVAASLSRASRDVIESRECVEREARRDERGRVSSCLSAGAISVGNR